MDDEEMMKIALLLSLENKWKMKIKAIINLIISSPSNFPF